MDRRDPYYWRAKREGYRSRAAYKLADLDARERFLRPGSRVLDLGCAPGGWMQVALERVGPSGRVVGVDVAEVAPFPQPNAALIVGDMRTPAVVDRLAEALDGQADVLLSDLSPKLSGIRDADIARSIDLVESAAEVARRLLRPGGTFVAKVFDAPETEALVARLRPSFQSLKVVNPEASRKASTESYLVAKGFKARRPGEQVDQPSGRAVRPRGPP